MTKLRVIDPPRWAPGFEWLDEGTVNDVPEPLAQALLKVGPFRLVLDEEAPPEEEIPEEPKESDLSLADDGASELRDAITVASPTRRRGRPRKED